MSPAFQPAEKNLKSPDIRKTGNYVLFDELCRAAADVFRSRECSFTSSEEFFLLVTQRLKDQGIFLFQPEAVFRDLLNWMLTEL